MNIMFDTEYNNTYPERPKRFIVADEGFGPTYITEDAVPTSLEKAVADVVRWEAITAWLAEQV